MDSGAADTETAGTELDPAARAFTQLGNKVSLLEAAITGLTAKRDAAPDYSETLGEIAALQGDMGQEIGALAQRPAMQFTPDVMAEQIAAAGERARASDKASIEQARARFDKAASRMEQLVGTTASVHEQRRRLQWAVGGGLLGGMLLWSFLPGVFLRALPQNWHMPENMARHIIGDPRSGKRAPALCRLTTLICGTPSSMRTESRAIITMRSSNANGPPSSQSSPLVVSSKSGPAGQPIAAEPDSTR